MSRSTIHNNGDYFLHDCDPVELDAVDELGWKDGVNNCVAFVHLPDVQADADHEDDSFNYGIDKQQYKANDEVDNVVKEESYVNRGKRASKVRTFNSRELFRRFEDYMKDELITDGEDDE
ncbi:hypothetical protein UFOVP53_119 [uncultured Caudovirales phage]|uniref:Uncharacterized protein n=1 Tax=uncultured Caudovirales phage TaxID=2100421 RepID=A0A6J5KWT6_9CAUD|nr:hypothetical protein UFOVP53_119 [uncultured Caudovirales phage]